MPTNSFPTPESEDAVCKIPTITQEQHTATLEMWEDGIFVVVEDGPAQLVDFADWFECGLNHPFLTEVIDSLLVRRKLIRCDRLYGTPEQFHIRPGLR
jgi:hypothetical protein